MRYKHFAKAGVDISELAVGTWAIGGLKYGDVSREESIGAIRAMLEQGVNLIDTAPAYGHGRSEMVVGEAIRGTQRDMFFISTKGGITPKTDGDMFRDARHKPLFCECERSLSLLGTDYIDFYFVHWPDPETPIEETMSALCELKKQGKIRFIGLSNFSKQQITEALQYGSVDVIQPPFNMINQGERELMEWCIKAGISTMSYGSMGAGLLTGAIREMPALAPDDFRLTFYDYYREPKFSRTMELLKMLDEIACEHGVPVAQVAVNWSTQQSFVSTALVGVRNRHEAEENTAAFEWSLTTGENDRISREIARLGLDL